LTQHLRRSELSRGKWLLIATFVSALFAVACGRVALLARSPTLRATPRINPAAGDGASRDDSRDARTLSAELMALTAFDESMVGGGDVRALASAAGSLRTWQWDEERGCSPSHPYFGGTRRWAHSVPDLMHTALMLRALRGAGVAENDPYSQRALTFIARCQVVDDSGGGGAGDRHDRGRFSTGPVVDSTGGTLKVRLGRPNGASTCLGLTSLLACGVAPGDVRVRDAVHWLEEHYSLDGHPGMARGREGLYGYYYEFARAMTTLGYDCLRDSRGDVHHWRTELKRKLSEQQNVDGSWTNPDESGDPAARSPVTTTSLALLTLVQLRR
jgi:squalene-hopene/tetraprenyl-beta-curcumene cyclase